MRKKIILISTIISDAFMALIGVLATIGFIELLNVIISIYMGEYVRIDGGDLSFIVKGYIEVAVLGYGMGWIFIICNRVANDDKKDPVQKTKIIINSTWIISIIIITIYTILTLDLVGALIMIILSVVLFGGALLLVYLWDRIVINEINNKIKENNEKKD